MNDFKTMAKTGKDFAVILFEKIAEDIENTIVEIYLDGMKMKTVLCDSSDASLTLNYLPEGHYDYIITQIKGETVSQSTGTFEIAGGDVENTSYDNSDDSTLLESLKKIELELGSIKTMLDDWGYSVDLVLAGGMYGATGYRGKLCRMKEE